MRLHGPAERHCGTRVTGSSPHRTCIGRASGHRGRQTTFTAASPLLFLDGAQRRAGDVRALPWPQRRPAILEVTIDRVAVERAKQYRVDSARLRGLTTKIIAEVNVDLSDGIVEALEAATTSGKPLAS